jgi:hypothetical protein
VALFGFQMTNYAMTKSMQTSLDTKYNGLYGIMLTLWAQVFIENWKRKEKKINQIWDQLGNKEIRN